MKRALLAICVAAFAAAPAVAAPSSPDVDFLLPRGGQRGSEVAIELRGSRLADAADLLFASSGLELLELTPVDETRVTGRLRIAPDCRMGEQQLRLRTRSGLSRLLTFWVGPFPTVDEVEPNSELAQAQPIARDVTVHGVVTNEDVDCFALDARAGERISVEVEALRLGDVLFDAFVAIVDERRFELASRDDSALFKQDPVLSALAPADGRYFVMIRESSYGGSDRCRYRMHVGSFPRPLALFPAGGKAGTTVELELRGDAAGPIHLSLPIPDPAPPDFAIWPEQEGRPAPSSLPFRVRGFESVAEVEPNDELAQATAVERTAPLAFDATIATPGDVDWFRFHAKKDERVNIRVHARQLRSALDPVMSIHALDGRQLDYSDDTIGLDSFFAFAAPEEGDFALRIADHLRDGSPLHTYRVELTAATPSMGIDVPRFGRDSQARQFANVPRGGRHALVIHAGRNSWRGPVAFAANGLPDGVTFTAVPMGASVDTTLLLFAAPADAPLAGRLVEITGESTVEPKVKGRLRQRYELVVAQPNDTSFYETYSDRLAVAVVEEAPFRIEVAAPKVPLVHYGQLALQVKVVRREGFDKPVTLRLLGAHTGIGAQPTIEVAAGQESANYLLNAGGDAEVRRHTVALLGEADGGRGVVMNASEPIEFDVAPPFVGLKLDLAAVEQGQTVQVVAHVTPNTPFTGKAKVTLLGLPAQATTHELECESAEATLVFDVATTKETPVGKHATLFCQVVIERDGEPIVHFLGGGATLRVDPPAPPAAPAPAADATAKAAAPAAPAAPAAEPPKKPLSRLEQLREEAKKKAEAESKPQGGSR
jgi:hypothetical protein